VAEVPVWEYTFGVFVAAADEQAAWEIVRPISEALDAIDVEGDSSVEGPFAADHEPQQPTPARPFVLLPEVDALAARMVELAGPRSTQRFRDTMKGWAMLAHRALSGA
jgi:hypothetical protein